MIVIRALTKKYGRREVLGELDADIPDRSITFLMGPNGSGKTTLIKALLGLERYKGSILYDGRDLSQVRTQIGVAYDDAPCYRQLTGLQNLLLLANGHASRSEVMALGDCLFGRDLLREKARRYSYGQQRKLAIVGAMAGSPQYLFMDEVSNGLDYESAEWLKGALRTAALTSTILLTGHQFDFYADIVGRVLTLKDGRAIVHDLPPAVERPNPLGDLYEEVFERADR
jgi:ABC-type multidrug transport system ATPase subunit